MPFIAIQLVVSVGLILLVSGLALYLKLGDDVRLRGEAEARELAATAVCGFDPVDLTLDRAGIGALLRDSQGRVMLLRRHGAQFAVRLLDSHAFARLDRNFLTIGTGEKTFGQVTLDLGDQAQVWAASLRRLGNNHA
ncbi:hypothetical protein [Novosphingobium sp.]|uniref:hypothetical protein n=1 Tax=Novosphingobium sp. TaxID=1874826 RepID=UPI002736D71E|nr:hypothetical protein [Novosphingobium sp.]MDP3906361.1 hypothetical protein [Novosphingobium sp.]